MSVCSMERSLGMTYVYGLDEFVEPHPQFRDKMLSNMCIKWNNMLNRGVALAQTSVQKSSRALWNSSQESIEDILYR